MSDNSQKFIVTKDKATATSLIASDTYTFLNQPPKHFNFSVIDKSKYCFSNILSM